jgi:hypothetical protein
VHDNFEMYSKGMEKFNMDMDLTSLIMAVRRMHIFTELLFNDNQKFLEKFNKHHVVERSNSDTLAFFDDLPSYSRKQNTQKVFDYNANVHEFVGRLSAAKLLEKDHFLISQILNDSLISITLIPRPNDIRETKGEL